VAKILAVDDNQEALFALEKLLSDEGFEVVTAQSGSETLDKLRSEEPDLVLLDVVMPAPDGYQVTAIAKADAELRYIPIVLLTSKDDLQDVIHGLSQGADDYIKKPFRREELLARVNAALRTRAVYSELKRTTEEKGRLEERVSEKFSYANIIGKSSAMRQVFEVAERVKNSALPVLILGESGTGKELIASALHYQSNRRGKAFVAQNCSAFSEELLESELFGHMKGAFSGAFRDKEGLFEVADGGTFFLDELGEMSLALQARLLRVLEDGCFMPVGSTKPKQVQVRVVAATNRDLSKLVAEGKFREDLYYRLNVVTIKLPALRERKEDIPALVEFFLKAIAKREGVIKTFSAEALQKMCDYGWPGNVRQLRNEIERAVLLSGEANEVPSSFFSAEVLGTTGSDKIGPSRDGALGAAIEKIEREMILATLQRLSWNKSEAARELGISRSSLIAKVQAYNLEKP